MINTIHFSNKTGKSYKVLKPLGKGQYGNVYLIQDNQSNKYALKLVDLKIIEKDKNMLKLLENEIKIMEMMNNPRILKLYDLMKINDLTGLVTMFCDGGNLEELILKESKNGLGEKDATFYLRQIAEGFKAMQYNKIIHRDLKLANIFLHQGNIVIGDFGFAKIGVSITKTKLGTPYYMAPEILNDKNKKSYSNKVDLWSIGVCYYFLIFGFMPFQDATDKLNLYNKEKKYSGQRLRFFNHNVSHLVKELLEKLIEFNPDKRMSFSELFKHPLINLDESNNNLLNNNMLKTQSQNLPNDSLLNSFNKFHVQSNGISNNDDLYLKNYLYYKNVIIFMMDTAKKIKSCENYKIESLITFIFQIELILIKKMININFYIKNMMEKKENKFGLSNFEYIMNTQNYKIYYKFFAEFSVFSNRLFEDSKKFMLKSNMIFNINEIENLDDNKCNDYLILNLKNILVYYKNNSFNYEQNIKTDLMHTVIYIFFNIDIFTKFPINSKFNDTKEWQDFCVYLNIKTSDEIEKRMYDFFKI